MEALFLLKKKINTINRGDLISYNNKEMIKEINKNVPIIHIYSRYS